MSASKSSLSGSGKDLGGLVCPKCRCLLDRAQEALICCQCNSRYPVAQGFPDFVPESDLYWGELSPEEMKRAIAQVEQGGYQAGVEYATSCCPGLREYLTNQCRIDWLFHCISQPKGGNCLDIGSGWGTLGRTLTNFYSQVWSMEIVKERLAFQAAVKRFEHLEGLKLVRASAIKLPFLDGMFDLVVANGIIQWIGLADPSRPVEILQQQFLEECRRVLRPEGVLFLGCENRYGFSMWMGEKDHSGLRYTSLLPRAAADWVVRRFRKSPAAFDRSLRTNDEWSDYRTYTYSVRGYERRLQGAGFKEVKSYWAYPSNNLPRFMGPLVDGRSVGDLLEFSLRNLDLRVQGSRFTRFILGLRHLSRFSVLMRLVVRWLAPSLVFFARPTGNTAALDNVVGPYTVRYGGSNKIVWLGRSRDGTRVVTKMARFPQDTVRVEHEEEMLQKHSGLEVVTERQRGWVLFREPFLHGHPIDCLKADDVRDSLAWLFSFQEQNSSGIWEGKEFAEEVRVWLRRFYEITKEEEDRQLAEQSCSRLLQAAARSALPKVAEHGDFWWCNIIRTQDGRISLIDWQHTRPLGDPIFDFAMLSYTHWETWQKHSVGRRSGENPCPVRLLDRMVQTFCERYNLNWDLVHAYYPYALMRRIVRSASLPRHDLLQLFRRQVFPAPFASPPGGSTGLGESL